MVENAADFSGSATPSEEGFTGGARSVVVAYSSVYLPSRRKVN